MRRAAFTTTPGWECIPTTAGQAVVSGGTGTTPACGAGSTAVLAPTYVSSAVGGKPTVMFSAVNVEIVSGSGATDGPVNGEGNLVIGYDENPNGATQTGSHDLIVGEKNGWTKYGEVVAGINNTATGTYASVLGRGNIASGSYSTVPGGAFNTASGLSASVSGGFEGRASGQYASILGGNGNHATTNCQAIPAAPGSC